MGFQNVVYRATVYRTGDECLDLVRKQYFEPHQISQVSGLLSGFNFILVQFPKNVFFFILQESWEILFFTSINSIFWVLYYMYTLLYLHRGCEINLSKKYLIIVIG